MVFLLNSHRSRRPPHQRPRSKKRYNNKGRCHVLGVTLIPPRESRDTSVLSPRHDYVTTRTVPPPLLPWPCGCAEHTCLDTHPMLPVHGPWLGSPTALFEVSDTPTAQTRMTRRDVHLRVGWPDGRHGAQLHITHCSQFGTHKRIPSYTRIARNQDPNAQADLPP
jgi:hypothetical protein